ncbi:hypothetical protein PRIPAC_88761 [Pristionchus pacificus]|uniref:Uncharacterized protein n=1 Tax=Pristionchus pacificus TaxID=54126 RepID=A0A2A6B8A1_PRIPA|nr:hypothetical protein PRIPAC_88761 [Pristionchus pacificus]|eukprot:PDM62095.1 hypothetical protein PRIPAC_51537 [Pristionchus pacificus]
MEVGKKKKKVPKHEEPDPGPKLAAAGSWILYPLTGGLHMDVKCRIICYCEAALSFIFSVLGFSNIFVYGDLPNGYSQIVNGLFLLCLFIEAFFGFRYRSPALLYLHTIQCVFIAFMLVMAALFSLTLMDHVEVSGHSIRAVIADMHSTAICFSIVLLSLGLASHARARDLLKMHRELPRHALGAVTHRLRERAGIMPDRD